MQQIKGSVINSMIIGHPSNNFCCLCFKTVADSAVHLTDKIIIRKQDQTYDEVYMIDILVNILAPEIHDQLAIFEDVCNQCSSAAINSYKFQTACKDNSLRLCNIIDGITKGTEKCIKNAKNNKAAFVSINTESFEYKGYNALKTSTMRSDIYQKFIALRLVDELANISDTKVDETDTTMDPLRAEPVYTTTTIKLFQSLRPSLVRLDLNILFLQKVFVCPVCEQLFSTRDLMHLHRKRKHGPLNGFEDAFGKYLDENNLSRKVPLILKKSWKKSKQTKITTSPLGPYSVPVPERH